MDLQFLAGLWSIFSCVWDVRLDFCLLFAMDSREGSDEDEDEGDYRFRVRAESKLGVLTTS